MEQLTISISQILGISSGLALLISVVVSALWAIYFNRIKEGQKAEFQKQIESLKAKNDKCNYISKTQFDAEFKMYQKLSEVGFNMLLDNSLLFPMGIDYLPKDETEQQKIFETRFETANKSMVIYQNMLFKYAPFLSENIYNLFDELKEFGRLQLIFYPDFKIRKDLQNSSASKDELNNCMKRTPKMFDKHNEIIRVLREYLKSLKVQEG